MPTRAGIVRGAVTALIALGAGSAGHAGAQERSVAAWRELTRADVEAAHAIIARNHPGAAVATGDTAFREALRRSLDAARRRSDAITSYEGWLATLRAFAVTLDDPHIALRPTLALQVVRWPGFVTGRQGNATVVAARDSTDPTLPAVGTRLVSCDGQTIESQSRQRLGTYRGTWDVAAQRVRNTPLLLVDDGNPFLPSVTRCVVSEDGAERSIDLRWRATTPTALQPYLRVATAAGRAGFGVRRAGGGWWIAIESLFLLPSGLGQFSTMQRVSFSTPNRLGPFDPGVPFPGRMDDTPALEAWIPSLLPR